LPRGANFRSRRLLIGQLQRVAQRLAVGDGQIRLEASRPLGDVVIPEGGVDLDRVLVCVLWRGGRRRERDRDRAQQIVSGEGVLESKGATNVGL